MRNITGRDQLPVGERRTCPHFIDRLYSSVAKALWPTERDSTALRYITWQYGKCTQTHPFKNHTNLLTWQTDHCTKNGCQGIIEHQTQPFHRLCSSFLCAYCSKKQAPTVKKKNTHSYVYCRLCNMRGHINNQITYVQLSPLYFLSILYITHMINYSRASPLFCTTSDGSWAGPGNKAKTTAKCWHPMM